MVSCVYCAEIFLMRGLGCAFPIQVMSDLHLEFTFRGPGNSGIAGYNAFDCKPCATVLALLGDIGLVSHEGLFVFLRRQLLKYEKILYVMGNHEFYSGSYVHICFFPFHLLVTDLPLNAGACKVQDGIIFR